LFLVVFLILQNVLFAQLANQYPHDIGIENNPNVLYVEQFEDDLSAIFSRYSDIGNANGMSLDNDVPEGSMGSNSLRISCIPGVNTGGHLYRRLPTGFDSIAYVRYYVKYPESSKGNIHHEGVWFGGYNPSSLWPLPGAGTCGLGDRRISIGFEPVWQNVDPHGMDTYLYWGDMRSWNDGTSCFGNTLVTQGVEEFGQEPIEGNYPTITFDEWMCIEIMVKLNQPATAYNGELAVWINGESIGHWGPGFPNGHWLRDKWYNNPVGQAFEGFRWRNTPDLIINWSWILFFHSNPNAPASHIKYDHIVMAKEYIGPIFRESSSAKKLTFSNSELKVFPNPSSGGFTIAGWRSADSRKTEITIMDMLGKNVYSEQVAGSGSLINISMGNKPDGVYFIHLKDSRHQALQKIVVRN
jgi:hypothetical protein